LDAHRSALAYLFDTFSSGGRQNVALVGPLGVGKQAIVHAFAEELMSADSRLPASLKFRQVVGLDASALISAARNRSELESLVNHLLIEAFKAKNIILCLEDASLFFEEGPGSVDISSILLPILEGGRLRMILTMSEQSWLRLAQRNPALIATLNRVAIAEPSEKETMMVMQDQLIAIEFNRKVTFMYQALKEAYRLSQRYLYDQAQPGKSVQLLESAAGYAEDGLVTARSVQRAIESSSGVKVDSVIDSQDEKDKLLNLEELIHARMINQKRAVNVVSDAIRRARAGVRNQSRPIGTFLFLGPTGVGKSELAKSLAAVYFGGEEKLIRLDLNEFVRSEDVSRLIADGAQDPHSLTASILKQPFSVVLLDEIEKAHPQVLNSLLQLLDEGVLRDINNREVSFRDAIIIATSNAGADKIRQYIDAGYELEQFETQLVNELIDSNQFRPEFLNRFDEIVVFRPLNEEELTQVVGLIIDGINKTMAHQKIRVSLTDGAKRKLASIGYDPRLGARPMRRVVQRSVESLIAKRMLEGQVVPGAVVEITEDDIKS
jgi:ATP-dependent Clp protease ATP-binding subunit ClpC